MGKLGPHKSQQQAIDVLFQWLVTGYQGIKGSKEDSVEQQLKDIKKLKFSKPYKDQSGKATRTSLRSTLN